MFWKMTFFAKRYQKILLCHGFGQIFNETTSSSDLSVLFLCHIICASHYCLSFDVILLSLSDHHATCLELPFQCKLTTIISQKLNTFLTWSNERQSTFYALETELIKVELHDGLSIKFMNFTNCLSVFLDIYTVLKSLNTIFRKSCFKTELKN